MDDGGIVLIFMGLMFSLGIAVGGCSMRCSWEREAYEKGYMVRDIEGHNKVVYKWKCDVEEQEKEK